MGRTAQSPRSIAWATVPLPISASRCASSRARYCAAVATLAASRKSPVGKSMMANASLVSASNTRASSPARIPKRPSPNRPPPTTRTMRRDQPFPPNGGMRTTVPAASSCATALVTSIACGRSSNGSTSSRRSINTTRRLLPRQSLRDSRLRRFGDEGNQQQRSDQPSSGDEDEGRPIPGVVREDGEDNGADGRSHLTGKAPQAEEQATRLRRRHVRSDRLDGAASQSLGSDGGKKHHDVPREREVQERRAGEHEHRYGHGGKARHHRDLPPKSVHQPAGDESNGKRRDARGRSQDT